MSLMVVDVSARLTSPIFHSSVSAKAYCSSSKDSFIDLPDTSTDGNAVAVDVEQATRIGKDQYIQALRSTFGTHSST